MNWSVWIQQLPNHMSEALEGARRVVSRQGLRNLALSAFLFLTMVATALGLIDLIAASEAGDISLIETIVVAALAGTAIVTMWLALEYTIEERRWGRRLLALVVYLLLVLWSIGFGFGFYWRHLASVGVAQDQTHQMMQRVDSGLSASSNAIAAIQGQMSTLSTAATNRADREDKQGGACDNVGTKPGQGDYWSVRQQISGEVTLVVGALGSWVSGRGPEATGTTSLAEDIEQVRAAATVAEDSLSRGTREPETMRQGLMKIGNDARDVIRRTNTIIESRDPYLKNLGDLAQRLEDGYGSGPVRCVDGSLARSLRLAAEQLAQLKPVSEGAADLNPQLGARATQFAFQRLWKNAFAILPGSQLGPGDTLQDRDLQALVAAIVVDIGIFFLTLFGRVHDPRGSLRRLLRGLVTRRDLDDDVRRVIGPRGEPLRDLFDESTVRCRGRYYLVTSEELPPRYEPIRNLQALLLAAGEGAPVPLGATAWPWQATLREAVRRCLARLLAAEARLSFELGTEAGEGEDMQAAAPSPSVERASLVELRAELVLTLQRLFRQSEEAAQDEPAASASGTPDSPGGHAGPAGAAPGPSRVGEEGAGPEPPR